MSHTGFIHSVQTLGASDGPGLRFVAFLQGCRMRCAYCHNPDTWSRAGGQAMTAEALVGMATRYRPYFGDTGGMTLSGGEPLLQTEFCLEVAEQAHAKGLHVCLDTAGGRMDRQVGALLEAADLVLLDIKRADEGDFRVLTGRDMSPTRAFLDAAKARATPLWIRQVIVPGLNDTAEEVRALAALVHGANIRRAQLLPYHTLGRAKWEALGRPYPLGDTPPMPEGALAALQAELDTALAQAK